MEVHLVGSVSGDPCDRTSGRKDYGDELHKLWVEQQKQAACSRQMLNLVDLNTHRLKQIAHTKGVVASAIIVAMQIKDSLIAVWVAPGFVFLCFGALDRC